MSFLFLAIYDFFRKYRMVFWILLITVTAGLGYFASRITLEEDITKFIPDNENLGKINKVFENLKSKDKLIIHLCVADSTLPANPEKLTACAARITDSIRARLFPQYVREI